MANNLQEAIELLGQTLAGMAHGGRPRFKPPTFDGTQNVEVFLRQFNDVAAQNEWNGAAAAVHLKTCLLEDAMECGTGDTVEEISTALRARFGYSVKQAKERLANLKRQPGQTLSALGSEVKRLVTLAYPDMPDELKETFSVDTFCKALGDRRLQQHLLNSQAETLTETITAADEWLQVGGRDRMQVNQVETTESKTKAGDDRLDKILTAIEGLTDIVKKQLSQTGQQQGQGSRPTQSSSGTSQAASRPKDKAGKPLASSGCWNCGGDHFRRDCPQIKTNKDDDKQSGNAKSPHQ
jgi:hypothetical protein